MLPAICTTNKKFELMLTRRAKAYSIPVHVRLIYEYQILSLVHPSLSFSALVRGDPLRIYGKALRFLKLEFSRQPTVKIW